MQADSNQHDWAQQAGPDTILRLHVRPGAKVAAVLGVHGARLKIAINAPPVEGKANEALLDLLAEMLQRPRRQLFLQAGGASREKTVRIEAAVAAEVAWCLLARAKASKQK